MSFFGKLLAILNVLAVLGALALMTMSYAQRRAWEYAVFKQDLMMKGLPLDDKETDEHENPLVDRIGEGTQRNLFKQASPNTPVATQKAEVDRVKTQLSAQIQGQADKQKKIYLLAHILTPMAVSSEERLRLMSYQLYLRDDKTFAALKARLEIADTSAKKLVADGKAKVFDEAFHEAMAAQFSDPLGPLGEEFLTARKADMASAVDVVLEKSLDAQLAQLDAQFNQMFADALNGGKGIQNGAPPQRKRSIARLLFNMVDVLPPPAGTPEPKPDLDKNPGYNRFVRVVGVKAALEAVNDQAGFLKEMAFGVEEERLRERGLFAQEHQTALKDVMEKKTLVELHKALYAIEKAEREKHEATVENRKRDVEFYQKELATERRKTAEKLKELNKLSDTLFHERADLQRNTEDNQKLEKQIRALEKGR